MTSPPGQRRGRKGYSYEPPAISISFRSRSGQGRDGGGQRSGRPNRTGPALEIPEIVDTPRPRRSPQGGARCAPRVELYPPHCPRGILLATVIARGGCSARGDCALGPDVHTARGSASGARGLRRGLGAQTHAAGCQHAQLCRALSRHYRRAVLYDGRHFFSFVPEWKC